MKQLGIVFTAIIMTFIALGGTAAHAETTTLDSDADTWVREGSSSNYGSDPDMYLVGGTGRVGYIRFDLSSLGAIEIADTTLTLTKVTGTWGRNDTLVTGRIGIVGLDNISGNTAQNWDETVLTSSNVGDEFVGGSTGYPIDSTKSTNLDAENGADVTENVASGVTFTLTGNDLVNFLQTRVNDDGLVTFIATFPSTDTKGFWLGTKENTTQTYRPVLEITYTPSRLASLPNPEVGATVSPDSVTLSWTGGYGAVRSEVYLGTNATAVANAQKPAGDVNGDGLVNMTDLTEMALQWLLAPSAPCPDLDYSGTVDLADFSEVSADWQDVADITYLGATTGDTFDPGTLDPATTYYWRVDSVACDGTEPGELWNFQTEAPAMPAFPGAEGFGAMATGGRGGDVYTVTNLNDDGAGSFKYGIDTATGPRTIVFAVSGYISFAGNNPVVVPGNITIAGQTAPGDGVGLKGSRLVIDGDNTIVRHFRIRRGKYDKNGDYIEGDCLNIHEGVSDTMIDHVSLMFSTDENFSFFAGDPHPNNLTMQYSSSTWGMERHNAGGLWDMDDVTCHHSLWAHHRTRNPKARPYGLLEWINNVTYHWRSEGFIMGDSQTATDWYANVIGCYYVSIADYEFGLDTTPLSKARIADDGLPNFHLYLNDTLIDANGDGVLNGVDNGYGIVSGVPYPTGGSTPGTVSYDKSATPFAGAPVAVTTDDPLTAYKKVLSSAGALRLDATYAGPLRDELDDLLIDSVENQESILVAKDDPRAEYPDDPPKNGEQHLADVYGITNNGFGTLNTALAPTDTDGDGMPDYWERSIGSSYAQQNNNAFVPSGAYVPLGYTLLDEYLYFCAIPHAAIAMNTASGPSSLTVDLSRYTRGFNVAPVTFSISNVQNGAATIQPDGSTVVFEPTLDFSGRARFDFTVTDGDGSTWTQPLAVLVESP